MHDMFHVPYVEMGRLSRTLERISTGKAGQKDLHAARKSFDRICRACEGNEKMSILWRGMREYYNVAFDHIERKKKMKKSDVSAIRDRCLAELGKWYDGHVTTFDEVAEKEFGFKLYVPDIHGGLPNDQVVNAPADSKDADSFGRFIKDMLEEQSQHQSYPTGNFSSPNPLSQYVDQQYAQDMAIAKSSHELGVPAVPTDEMARTMAENDPQWRTQCEQYTNDYANLAQVSGNPFMKAASDYQIKEYCGIQPVQGGTNYSGGITNKKSDDWWTKSWAWLTAGIIGAVGVLGGFFALNPTGDSTHPPASPGHDAIIYLRCRY